MVNDARAERENIGGSLGRFEFDADVRDDRRPGAGDRTQLEEVKRWLDDRAAMQRKDPYFCTAIANGTKP